MRTAQLLRRKRWSNASDRQDNGRSLDAFPAFARKRAVLRYPRANERKGRFGLFPALAEDYEVIRVTHHLVAMAGHQLIERVQVDVRQERG